MRGCIVIGLGVHRYKVKGCIVELYQFHCTNEPLSLRLLSGYEPMYLHARTDPALSGETEPALPGPDGHLRGGPQGRV